jgi:hypothetical protein
MRAVKSLSVCAHSASRLQSHAVVTYTHRVAENFRSAPRHTALPRSRDGFTVAPLRTVLVTWITDLKERPLHIKRTADERDRLPGQNFPGAALRKFFGALEEPREMLTFVLGGITGLAVREIARLCLAGQRMRSMATGKVRRLWPVSARIGSGVINALLCSRDAAYCLGV